MAEREGLRIQVNDRIDYAALRRNANSVRDRMKTGMGDAAYSAMRARSRKRTPWTTLFREDLGHEFYRGTLQWQRKRSRIVSEGMLVVSMQVDGDTIAVRDQGVLILVGEDQLDWRFTGNGPIDLTSVADSASSAAEFPIIIRLPSAGTIIAVAIDSTRTLVPSNGKRPRS